MFLVFDMLMLRVRRKGEWVGLVLLARIAANGAPLLTASDTTVKSVDGILCHCGRLSEGVLIVTWRSQTKSCIALLRAEAVIPVDASLVLYGQLIGGLTFIIIKLRASALDRLVWVTRWGSLCTVLFMTRTREFSMLALLTGRFDDGITTLQLLALLLLALPRFLLWLGSLGQCRLCADLLFGDWCGIGCFGLTASARAIFENA